MVVSDTFLENPNYSSFLLLETILVCGLFLIFVGEYKTLKDNGKKRKSLVKKSPFKLRRHAHGDLTQLHTIMFFRPVEMLPNVASGTFRKAGIGNYEDFVHVDNEKIGLASTARASLLFSFSNRAALCTLVITDCGGFCLYSAKINRSFQLQASPTT